MTTPPKICFDAQHGLCSRGPKLMRGVLPCSQFVFSFLFCNHNEKSGLSIPATCLKRRHFEFSVKIYLLLVYLEIMEVYG